MYRPTGDPTARCEAFLVGNLNRSAYTGATQSLCEAGADCLYAQVSRSAAEIRRLLRRLRRSR